MRRVLILTIFLACHGNESSPTSPPINTAALTGKVTNATNNVPIEKVQITVMESNQTMTTSTSSTGSYSFFTGLIPGSITITAKATGFVTATGTTTVTAGSNRYDIQLRPTA